MSRGFVFASLFACCATGFAQQANPIFGLQLGAVLANPIPKCDGMEAGISQWCGVFGSISAADKGIHRVLRPQSPSHDMKVPDWIVRGREMHAVRIADGGEVVEIEVKTYGLPVQASVIESISARFGEPSAKEVQMAQNAYGQTWEVTVARWEQAGVTITHDCPRRDRCSVRFLTAKGVALREADAEARKKKNAM